MKNNFFYIALMSIFFTGINLHSQYFDGGFMLGFSVSQVDGDTYAGYHQPGLSGGVYSSRKLSSHLKGIVELRYTAKGARYTDDKNDPLVYHQKFRYIELPVKFNYYFENYNSSLESGVVSGYLFNYFGEYNGSEIVYDNPLKKFEFSWVIGAKYHINDNMVFSLQYNYSLMPIVKYENTDYNYGALARWLYLTKGDYNNVIIFSFYFEIGN